MDAEIVELIKTLLSKELNSDSIEIGTPSKGGVLKVYFNADADPSIIEAKLNKAMNTLELARMMYNREKDGGGC